MQQGAAATVSQGEPAADGKAGKVLRALRVDGASPRIDGQLDDEFWQRAESAEGFIHWEPDNMAPLSERTVVQVGTTIVMCMSPCAVTTASPMA